jgi:hypothetical protein
MSGDTIDWTPAAGGGGAGAAGGDATAFADEACVEVGIITQMQKRYPGKLITIELNVFEYRDFIGRFVLSLDESSAKITPEALFEALNLNDDGHDEIYIQFARHRQRIMVDSVAAAEEQICTERDAARIAAIAPTTLGQSNEDEQTRIAAIAPTALGQFNADEQTWTPIGRLQMEKPP